LKKQMLTTLIELQRLKRLDRTGWTLRGLPNGTESVASHSFGGCVAAMMLTDKLLARGVEIDAERVLRTALLHDWAETRVGDMPRTATSYFGADVRKRAETAAFADLVAGASAESQYRALHSDYEQRQTLEARLVKAADVIDLLVQVLALERGGAKGLDEFWEALHADDFQLEGAPHEVVFEVLQMLKDARNKK
jgi:putative hydrolases of HD superfamily